MHPPSRARRIFKWTGAGLSLLILAVWVASLWFSLTAVLTDDRAIHVSSGTIGAVLVDMDWFKHFPQPTGFETHDWDGLGLEWPSAEVQAIDFYSNTFHASIFKIPLWLLLLVPAIPTAWLWYRSRRRIRPGCCLRCGYNLTGNTSGVCSECGLSVAIALETSGQ